ncbi:MAG: alpha/beta hydrolase, partial [Mesorhizobium sp.]
QVLIYPELGGETGRSYLEHAEAPLLDVGDIESYRRFRSAPGQSLDDPTFSPLRDSDFTDLPPTFIITAACDPLSCDGETYRDR